MNVLRNGKSEEQLREEQRQNQLHQMNLSTAEAEQPMDTSYIQQMTEHELEEPTVDMLSNLLDRDFMLSNLNEAEVHEYRWLARVMTLEIEALHPADDAVLSGHVRAAAFNDKGQNLNPLSGRQKAVVEQFIMAVISRATRGREGWQQEMFNKSISASETRQIDEGDDGGFL